MTCIVHNGSPGGIGSIIIDVDTNIDIGLLVCPDVAN